MSAAPRFIPSLARLWLTALLLVLAIAGAPARADEPTRVTGAVSYQLIGTYNAARFAKITGEELKDFTKDCPDPAAYLGTFPAATHAVKLYKVTYPSAVPELGNRPTRASGLVAVPETGKSALPMLSYQHGTVFDASYVPSQPENSAETRLVLARFAAQGYIVIGADYFGRGDSDLPDSYLVKASTQQATYDMLIAARQMLAALKVEPTQIFLSGWSQGGWATMAFLQKLEGLGEKVSAAAVASGPMDISLVLNRWLNNPQPIDAIYLPAVVAMQLQAKAYYNQMPGIDAVAIKPDYLDAARQFYAGKMDFFAFLKATSPKLADFTNPAFRAEIAAGTGNYWQLLDASQVYRWRRATPVKSWYGGSDEVTPVDLAKLPALANDLTGGASFETVDAGAKADHRGVFVKALLDQKPWFDGLRTP